MDVTIERCQSLDHPGWLALRERLWPECSRSEHIDEMSAFLSEPCRFAQFVAAARSGDPAGIAEFSLRRDQVIGTTTVPVAYVEGIYVAAEYRRKGIASGLLAAGADWGRSRGCRELAADVALDNPLGQVVHGALGFEETERVVFFRMALAQR